MPPPRHSSPAELWESALGKLRRFVSPQAAQLLAIRDGRAPRAPLARAADQRDGESWLQLPEGLPLERLDEFVDRDPWPLPHPDDREGYHGERHFDYWLSGLTDWWSIGRTLARHGADLAPGAAVLDLGCASGRVLRHFLAQGDRLDLFGADINHRHVEWVRRHLASASCKPLPTTILPTLPLPDHALDLVYAFSVLTHIDEFELGWLAELRRVLAPGGIAYLTIHSEHTWSALNPDWALWHGLIGHCRDEDDRPVTARTFEEPMGRERAVFRWKRSGNYICNVFHRSDYIQGTWGRFFDVLEIVEEGADYQDVVVLRRPRR
ncbi:class I SAM-dependent methyltransferase [Engelhardtia mirabilis]|uniref:Methyltransferase domain-containing protein n=1 Tax=Engelhardtia mirabilis TaxID=2528011 RepID=A0A518BQJ6_9BACT|nr:hypothetical protein Pla133_43370 [Planctomycetes bacterium Pla133]QDV03547.1 hypothetical protein Pla86_43360 [Planctomycetes bacterium Pla86]